MLTCHSRAASEPPGATGRTTCPYPGPPKASRTHPRVLRGTARRRPGPHSPTGFSKSFAGMKVCGSPKSIPLAHVSVYLNLQLKNTIMMPMAASFGIPRPPRGRPLLLQQAAEYVDALRTLCAALRGTGCAPYVRWARPGHCAKIANCDDPADVRSVAREQSVGVTGIHQHSRFADGFNGSKPCHNLTTSERNDSATANEKNGIMKSCCPVRTTMPYRRPWTRSTRTRSPDETIPAPAAAEKSTNSAAARAAAERPTQGSGQATLVAPAAHGSRFVYVAAAVRLAHA